MMHTIPSRFSCSKPFARCFSTAKAPSQASLSTTLFGRSKTGIDVNSYTLTNNTNMSVEIINYGGHIRRLLVPNKRDELVDVVTGLDSIEEYENGLENNPYFGCITGRFANRIAEGKFSIAGREYQLALNNGLNTLHGGPTGFHTRLWRVEDEINTSDEIGIRLRYISLDMEEGYPGELDIIVDYALNKNNNKLIIRYNAITDSKDGTIINLTNHSYFNLNDNGPNKFSENSLLDTHEVNMKCKYITPINENLIPTGELLDVTNTPFDFYNKFNNVGHGINDPNCEQIKNGEGIDHNFVIEKESTRDLVECTRVRNQGSGIEMAVETTEPGIQMYTGNFLDGTITGKEGYVYNRRSAMCLETQHFPDAPNQPSFPSTLLKKGETYESYTAYSFGLC